MAPSGDDNPLVLLIDHDNVPFKDVEIKTIIERWLLALWPELPDSRILGIDARAYGGWWVGDVASDGRYRAAEFYQALFPSVMEFEQRFLRLRFAFADYLISDPGGVRITNTVVSRASPQYVTLRASAASCTETDCQLPAIRSWIRRRRACAKPGCPHTFESQFERKEQKQVDVHLATDLLAIAAGRYPAPHVGVISDDADLIPAIMSAAAAMPRDKTLTLIRVVPRSTYVDAVLEGHGVKIVSCST